MYVSCLIVQAQRIEEAKLKKKTRESKRVRNDKRNFSHSRSGGGNSSNELIEHKFQSGGKSRRIECLANSNACFCCGKMDHNVRDCP